MWYFAQNNQQHGPVSEEELKFKIRSGILVGSSLVWKEGMSDWKPASAVTEFSMLVGSPISSSERLGSSNETPPFSDPYSPPQNSPVPSFSPPTQTGPPINGGGILAFGIMVTMLCCMPFGIAGIVYAAQINSKQSVGDYLGAQESARIAMMWNWIGFGIGLVMYVLALLSVLVS